MDDFFLDFFDRNESMFPSTFVDDPAASFAYFLLKDKILVVDFEIRRQISMFELQCYSIISLIFLLPKCLFLSGREVTRTYFLLCFF